MAEIDNINQALRASIGRDLVRSGEVREDRGILERRRQDADAAISGAVREREDEEDARILASRRREDARRAELETRSQRHIDLAPDGSAADLPRGSIIDILA